MRSKTIILSTAAVLALAGAVASPGYARTHHRAHHGSGSSTPAERAQTADLNRQQLQQAQTASAGMTPTGNPSLSTTPTTYQRPGTAGSMSAPSNAETAPSQDMAAPADTAAPATPGTSATPPPADNSGGTQ
jgi:hypothetical protein